MPSNLVHLVPDILGWRVGGWLGGLVGGRHYVSVNWTRARCRRLGQRLRQEFPRPRRPLGPRTSPRRRLQVVGRTTASLLRSQFSAQMSASLEPVQFQRHSSASI